ncbi:MAG: FGGY family carbohydrate kinase [Dehalococcoidia bacterium]|jgi:xylulokinase|nr:FGGY family carbohydrate kinase [Dehalococcoidia bacterium]
MATDSCYLGIDVGSSGVKVMLVRSDGGPLGVASAGYETSYPHPGHVEQNQDDWYRATCLAVREVLGKNRVAPENIGGIGLSGTSHVPSMLDEHYRLVRPGILWNDIRSEAQVRRLEEEAGDLIVSLTGNSINCTWSLAQLAWVREHESEAFRRTRHVLFSKDYLAYRLTGELAADHSSAVSSLLVEADSLEWNRELRDLAGLASDMVPPIHPSTAVIGELTPAAASDLGLPLRVPVVIGMLDSAAELVGVGATEPSVAVIRLGTAGGVMTLTDGPKWRRGCMLYPHPVRPQWYYQAGTNAATISLQWVMSLLGMSTDGGYSELDGFVAQVPPGANGLLFHPYLIGERAPYWSSRIRGGFSGVTINHGRAAFLRAVQEGVAYSLRDCTSLLDWDGVSDIRLCGGGARSASWCRIIADVLGLPVHQMRQQDASALGAALAAVAGCTRADLRKLAQAGVTESVRIEPDPMNRDVYDSGYRKYRALADQYLKTFDEAL